jgi:hypothetical protein
MTDRRRTRRRVGVGRWVGVTLSLGALAVVAGACSTTDSGAGGTTAPSTIAAGTPWLGTFTSVSPPVPVNTLADVDCVTALRCWAVGSTVGGSGAPNGAAVLTTDDGGARWTNQVIPATIGYIARIACSDRLSCTAVGQATQTTDGQAVVIATTDGGTTWVQVPVPAGLLDVTAVTCLDHGPCLAIGETAGGAVAITAAGPGTGWTTVGSLPAGVTGATGISCTSDDDCWATATTPVSGDAVAGSVVLTTDGGAHWVATPVPKGLGEAEGLSCLPGPTVGTGAVTSTAPTSAATGSTSGSGPVTSTTAPAPSTTAPVGVAGVDCVVVGTTASGLDQSRTGHGLVLLTADGGATWSEPTVDPTIASLADVSCVGVSRCVAVGSTVATSPGAGTIVLTGAATDPWRDLATVDAALPLTGVSCVSTSACQVVGESISLHLVGG